MLHDRNPQYVVESDGSVRNGYMIKLLNMIPEQRRITLTLEGIPSAQMRIAGQAQGDGRSFSVGVDPDKVTSLKVSSPCRKQSFQRPKEASLSEPKTLPAHERDVYPANSINRKQQGEPL